MCSSPTLDAAAPPGRRRSPYVLIGVALLAGAVVPASVLLRRAGGPREGAAPERGDRAPEFAARTEDGGVVSLDTLTGHSIVLHFCGSWNPQCEDDLEFLVEARQEAADPDLAIVDVLVADDLARAKRLYLDRGADWVVVADPGGLIADAYGVGAVPQTFFIDRAGKVRARNFGALAPTTLEGRIEDLLTR